MQNLAHPWALLLLVALPPLIGWWLMRRHGALLFSETASFARTSGRRGPIGTVVITALWTAALLSLIVALAGPRWPDERTRLPAEGIAIEMVLDVSGSMNEQDFLWQSEKISRLEAAKRAFRLFVEGGAVLGDVQLKGRPNDVMGLITFSSWPDVVCPLTLDHSALLKQLDAQEAQPENTNIGDAILWGVNRLQKATPRRRVLILLTDGQQTAKGPNVSLPRPAAQVAANLPTPVIIYTIDAGRLSTLAGESAVERKDAQEVLLDIARITGGKYFAADDSRALVDACREIDLLEREEIQSFHYRRYFEGYPWFGLAAFVLLVTATVLEMTGWKRIP